MDLITSIGRVKKVSIFSDLMIDVDKNLPKYTQPDKNVGSYVNPSSFKFADAFDNNVEYLISPTPIDTIDLHSMKNLRWYEKIIQFLFMDRAFKKEQAEKEKEEKRQQEIENNKMSIVDFFANVKTEMTNDEARDYDGIIYNYLKEMTKAKNLGQTAIYEQMKIKVAVMKMEAILQTKKVKFLTEEQMVKLGENTKKGIKIDYIKNFGRIIPDDIYEKKLEADSWLIYDNYVVVHYDPGNTGTVLTEDEKQKEYEKKKDPILFGVISGSTNLYYVGDWVDDYCDLTLDKAIEIINGK